MIGDGPCRPELEELSHKLDLEKQVIFAGMVRPEDICRYYHAGDIFVSASTSETQGLTYLEALASGLPLLCRRDDCLSGVLTDGVNGWQYATLSEFSDRLAWFMEHSDLYTELHLRALESSQKFSVEAFLPDTQSRSTQNKFIFIRMNTGGGISHEYGFTQKSIWRLISLMALVACIGIAVWGIQCGVFTSRQSLEEIVAGYGAIGPVLFILIQIVQVVLPILPGGISCLAGVILFGAVKGFIYNYVGICIGSLLAFALAKNYGRPLLPKIFGEKMLQKYDGWTGNKKRFEKLFASGNFLCRLRQMTFCVIWQELLLCHGKHLPLLFYWGNHLLSFFI